MLVTVGRQWVICTSQLVTGSAHRHPGFHPAVVGHIQLRLLVACVPGCQNVRHVSTARCQGVSCKCCSVPGDHLACMLPGLVIYCVGLHPATSPQWLLLLGVCISSSSQTIAVCQHAVRYASGLVGLIQAGRVCAAWCMLQPAPADLVFCLEVPCWCLPSVPKPPAAQHPCQKPT